MKLNVGLVFILYMYMFRKCYWVKWVDNYEILLGINFYDFCVDCELNVYWKLILKYILY